MHMHVQIFKLVLTMMKVYGKGLFFGKTNSFVKTTERVNSLPRTSKGGHDCEVPERLKQ